MSVELKKEPEKLYHFAMCYKKNRRHNQSDVPRETKGGELLVGLQCRHCKQALVEEVTV